MLPSPSFTMLCFTLLVCNGNCPVWQAWRFRLWVPLLSPTPSSRVITPLRDAMLTLTLQITRGYVTSFSIVAYWLFIFHRHVNAHWHRLLARVPGVSPLDGGFLLSTTYITGFGHTFTTLVFITISLL